MTCITTSHTLTHTFGLTTGFKHEQKYRANAILGTKEITTSYVYLYNLYRTQMKYSKCLNSKHKRVRSEQREEKLVAVACKHKRVYCMYWCIIIIERHRRRISSSLKNKQYLYQFFFYYYMWDCRQMDADMIYVCIGA